MKTLLDTNILVHAYNKSSPQQKKASEIIRKAMQGDIEACLSPQVLYEFFAVVTSSKRVEHPMLPRDAAELCIDLWECNEIEKLNPSGVAPLDVFKCVKEYKLSKAEIFDCALAVTAKENEVVTVYTENVADFKRYKFLKALNPLT
ncbi:MAG: PIN domain-containing protein [Candidatus Bathyarchaeota archaeon]|nr:PIN domain-containing protein [Candidatus Bathyarchaeota archaeon]